MQKNRSIVTSGANEREQPLRFSERISADDMTTLGEELQRGEKLADFGGRIGVAEYRQAERCFGDEAVASHRFERPACRVGLALVIARYDNALAVQRNKDLRRA